MRPRERQQWIAETVGREGQVSIDVLAARLSVSAETIRRDLGLLDDHGVIKKVHGGAIRPRMTIEGDFEQRMGENIAAKRAIATKLVDVIEDNATLLIDTGSTTLACAQALAATRSLTVITNSVRIAAAFAASSHGGEVFLLGGHYSPGNSQTVGAMTIEQLAGFQADYAVLSPSALDSETGLMDSNFAEASVGRAMISRSSQLVVAADASKLGKRAAFAVSGLEAVDLLVCDIEPNGILRDRLASCNVRIC